MANPNGFPNEKDAGGRGAQGRPNPRYAMPLCKGRNVRLEAAKSAVFIDVFQIGAGGGTRTHTTFYSPRILSPVRLPFRHTGNPMFTSIPC